MTPERDYEKFARVIEALRHQVFQWGAGDRNAQGVHACEVRLALLARRIRLGEEDFLIWPMKCPPVPKTPLERSQLPQNKSIRVPALELFKNCLSLKTRVLLQQHLDLRPYFDEGIRTRLPIVLLS